MYLSKCLIYLEAVLQLYRHLLYMLALEAFNETSMGIICIVVSMKIS